MAYLTRPPRVRAVNRAAVELLVKRWREIDAGATDEKCDPKSKKAQIALCLKRFDTVAIDTREASGAERFHVYGPVRLATGAIDDWLVNKKKNIDPPETFAADASAVSSLYRFITSPRRSIDPTDPPRRRLDDAARAARYGREDREERAAIRITLGRNGRAMASLPAIAAAPRLRCAVVAPGGSVRRHAVVATPSTQDRAGTVSSRSVAELGDVVDGPAPRRRLARRQARCCAPCALSVAAMDVPCSVARRPPRCVTGR